MFTFAIPELVVPIMISCQSIVTNQEATAPMVLSG